MNLFRLLLLLTLTALPGCAWWRSWARAPQAPQAFQTTPTIEQLAQHINSNPVRQLEAERAKISLSGLPAVTARLALERPRSLRFRVEIPLGGAELDAGSNPELFWMWNKREDAVYFARHDQFAGSAARQAIPVQPEWIGEALGLVYLDPAGKHEGPIDRGNHRLEIRSKLFAPDGELTRVMIVNDVYGWILEQHLYDPRGQLIASAKASEHRHYAAEGVSLPHKVEIQLPPASLSFTLDVTQYNINRLSATPEQLFTMPRFEGAQVVDVADPNFAPPVATPARVPVSQQQSPRLRGY
jgi:hypothetical protein